MNTKRVCPVTRLDRVDERAIALPSINFTVDHVDAPHVGAQ